MDALLIISAKSDNIFETIYIQWYNYPDYDKQNKEGFIWKENKFYLFYLR